MAAAKRFRIYKCKADKSDKGCGGGHWVLSDHGSESIHCNWQAALDKMNYRINHPEVPIFYI